MSIKIETNVNGAELTSIKFNGEERLHDGLEFWKRHSPILFPMVGRLKNDKTLINGKEYEMFQHGFARDMDFEVLEKNEKCHSYMLKSNSETLKRYPFEFILTVNYLIGRDCLYTQYSVINNGEKDMPFGIGAHPAYKVDYSKCYLEFEEEEKNIKFYELADGLIAKEVKKEMENNKKFILNKNTFEKDAIIMKNVKSSKVFLKEKETDKTILEFNFKGFPYLATWSKENASFLCLEPWYTTADEVNSNGVFEEKEGTILLKPNEEFKCEYKVKFY